MNGIYQRGDIWWINYRRNGQRRFESSQSSSRQDAVALLERRRRFIGVVDRPTDFREARLSRAIYKTLLAQGVKIKREVRCGFGIVDLIIDGNVWEVKATLDARAAINAVGQLTVYSKALGGNRKLGIIYQDLKLTPEHIILIENLGIVLESASKFVPWINCTSIVTVTPFLQAV